MDNIRTATRIKLNYNRKPVQVVLRPKPNTKYFKSGKDLDYMVVYGEVSKSGLCNPVIFEETDDAHMYRLDHDLSSEWRAYMLTDLDVNGNDNTINVISTNASTPDIKDVLKTRTLQSALYDYDDLHFEYLHPGDIVLRPMSQRKIIGKYTEYLVVYGEQVNKENWAHITFKNIKDAKKFVANNAMTDHWIPYVMQGLDCNHNDEIKVAINQSQNIPDWIISKSKNIPDDGIDSFTDTKVQRSVDMKIEDSRTVVQLNPTIILDDGALTDMDVAFSVNNNIVTFTDTSEIQKSRTCKVMIPGLGIESMMVGYNSSFSVGFHPHVTNCKCNCNINDISSHYKATICVDNGYGDDNKFDIMATGIKIMAINTGIETDLYDVLVIIIPQFQPLTLSAIYSDTEFYDDIMKSDDEARVGFINQQTLQLQTPYKIFGWHVVGSSIVLNVVDEDATVKDNPALSNINTNAYKMKDLFTELENLCESRPDITYFGFRVCVYSANGDDIIVDKLKTVVTVYKYTDTNQVFFKIG